MIGILSCYMVKHIIMCSKEGYRPVIIKLTSFKIINHNQPNF